MAMVLCPECGEETMDQLVSCPRCDESLSKKQESSSAKNARLTFFGLAFSCGLIAATLCNMMGYTGWAMGFGTAGVVSMVALIFNLQAQP